MAQSTPPWIHAVVPVVVSLVLGYLIQSRKDSATTSNEGEVVAYGSSWRWMTWLMGPIPFVILAIVAFHPPKPEEWWIPYALAGGFAAMIGPLWLEVFRRRVVLDEHGLTSHSPWSDTITMPWSSVRRVTFNAAMQWWVIEDARDQRIRVSVYMSGVKTLSQALKTRTRDGLSLAGTGV